MSNQPKYHTHSTAHIRNNGNKDNNNHHHTTLHINNNNNKDINNNNNNNNNNNGPIISLLSNTCDNLNDCTEVAAKWTWLYIMTATCRYLAYFFVGITIIAIAIIIAAKIGYDNNNENQVFLPNGDVYLHQDELPPIDRNRAEELTGINTLKLLTQTIFELFNGKQQQQQQQNEQEVYEDIYEEILLKDRKISAIQSIDSATVFIKSSEDDSLHFIPFRKPKDSYCLNREFSFQSECVNVHNVRDVTYHSKNKELEFLISGSYPRLIEINKESIIILNDRLFKITDNDDDDDDDDEHFEEITDDSYYQDGNKFCENNINIIDINGDGKDNRIIISGSCYGLLYLPKSIFWNNNKLQLLSSKWSSIIIDSNMYIESLIIASNNEGSIIFRNKLTTNNLNLAITDNAYVEFKQIHDANYISMITLKGSQIYISSINECKIIDFAARNHSTIEISNIFYSNDIHLSISHFSIIRIPTIKKTKLNFKRGKNTQLLLPNPYKNIQNDKELEKTLSFS